MTSVTIEILEPGSFTTVQDLGRGDYQKYGIPPSGAIDPYSFQLANLLVGNERGAAGLEATISGPTIEFREETWFAIGATGWKPRLNGTEVPLWRSIKTEPGDRLSFEKADDGARAYVAVAGGIDVPSVLGSKSTNVRAEIGGFDGRALRAGDVLDVGTAGDVTGQELPDEYRPTLDENDVRVVLGPQDDHFTDEGIDTFLGSTYTIDADSDRMGIRLEGPAIEHARGADVISEGTAGGAIQVPENGTPIVLLSDRQTTGGYAKIATVIEADRPKLARMCPPDEVTFRDVSLAEAYEARDRRRETLETVARRLKAEELTVEDAIETEAGDRPAGSAERQRAVTASMPGEIVTVHVSEGDEVETAEDLVVFEAMKMENTLTAPFSGVVTEVSTREGEKVQNGEPLLTVRR